MNMNFDHRAAREEQLTKLIPTKLKMHPLVANALEASGVDLARFAAHVMERPFESPFYPGQTSGRDMLDCLPPSFPPILGKQKHGTVLVDRLRFRTPKPSFFSNGLRVARVTADLNLTKEERAAAVGRPLIDYVPDPIALGLIIEKAELNTQYPYQHHTLFRIAPDMVELDVPSSLRPTIKAPLFVEQMTFMGKSFWHPTAAFLGHFQKAPGSRASETNATLYTKNIVAAGALSPGKILAYEMPFNEAEWSQIAGLRCGVHTGGAKGFWIFPQEHLDIAALAAIIAEHHPIISIEHDWVTDVLETPAYAQARAHAHAKARLVPTISSDPVPPQSGVDGDVPLEVEIIDVPLLDILDAEDEAEEAAAAVTGKSPEEAIQEIMDSIHSAGARCDGEFRETQWASFNDPINLMRLVAASFQASSLTPEALSQAVGITRPAALERALNGVGHIDQRTLCALAGFFRIPTQLDSKGGAFFRPYAASEAPVRFEINPRSRPSVFFATRSRIHARQTPSGQIMAVLRKAGFRLTTANICDVLEGRSLPGERLMIELARMVDIEPQFPEAHYWAQWEQYDRLWAAALGNDDTVDTVSEAIEQPESASETFLDIIDDEEDVIDVFVPAEPQGEEVVVVRPSPPAGEELAPMPATGSKTTVEIPERATPNITDQLGLIAAEALQKALQVMISSPDVRAQHVWAFHRLANEFDPYWRSFDPTPQDAAVAARLDVTGDIIWALYTRLKSEEDIAASASKSPSDDVFEEDYPF